MKKVIFLFISLSAAVFLTSCSDPVIPQGHALVYGIENYPSYNSLMYTVDDAEAVAALLERKGWSVNLRTNSAATVTQLQADVSALKQTMASGDRFLLYFSGHGFYIPSAEGEPASAADGNDETIVFYDAMMTDDELGTLLLPLPAQTRTVIIDACYSGGFIGDGFTYNAIPQDYQAGALSATFTPAETFGMYIGFTPNKNDLAQSGFSVLAASGELEESYESASVSHGIFTNFLLETPETADYNFDGYISLTEAWRYTSLRVDSYWNGSSFISTAQEFMPNLSAFPVDPVLFRAD